MAVIYEGREVVKGHRVLREDGTALKMPLGAARSTARLRADSVRIASATQRECGEALTLTIAMTSTWGSYSALLSTTPYQRWKSTTISLTRALTAYGSIPTRPITNVR